MIWSDDCHYDKDEERSGVLAKNRAVDTGTNSWKRLEPVSADENKNLKRGK